jgi:AraC family transcriptional regulator, activator of mtrCDE
MAIHPRPPVARPTEDEPGDRSRAAIDLLARMRHVLEDVPPDATLSVRYVAEALGMSRATLYRRMQDHALDTPMDVIWRLRLEQAAFWLRETEAAVADIAHRAGFRTAAHFSSRFRACYGTTPSGFRQHSAARRR